MDIPRLDYSQQLQRLIDLGIKSSTEERDILSLKTIGYYKLKEFAHPFMVRNPDIEHYDGLSFEALVKRYFQDKNLRMQVLHAIESIEVAVDSQIANVLGEKYGAFGYLNFSLWTNRKKMSKFQIEQAQFFFKRDLKKQASRSALPDMGKTKNLDSDGFPTVWLMVDTLTFGGMVHLLSIMAPANQRIIARQFNCSSAELLSWLGCLNLVRNICSHNSDLLDIRFVTTPLSPTEFTESIFRGNSEAGLLIRANRIAVALFIIKHFMNIITPNYNFHEIAGSIYRVTQGNSGLIHSLGFSDKASIGKLNGRVRK